MKKIIFTAIILAAFTAAHSQLTNTKWKGTLQLDAPTDVVLIFKADTLSVIIPADSSTLEVMVYTVQDTAITLKKVSGQSDCGEDVPGKYKYEIKDNTLQFTLINDDCDDRSENMDGIKWIKQQ